MACGLLQYQYHKNLFTDTQAIHRYSSFSRFTDGWTDGKLGGRKDNVKLVYPYKHSLREGIMIKQGDESFDQSATDLKLLIMDCCYQPGQQEELIRDHIVRFGVKSQKMCEKLIQEDSDMTLKSVWTLFASMNCLKNKRNQWLQQMTLASML